MSILQLLQSRLNSRLLVSWQLVAQLVQLILGSEDHRVSLIQLIYLLTLLLISSLVSLSLSLHTIDLVLAQAAGSLDTDSLFLTGSLILSRYLQDTVGIDIKGHLNLRHTTTCRSNASQVKLTDTLVLSSHRTLALQHMDSHFCLIISGSRESLALLYRDGCVSINQLGHHTTKGLDTQGQRSNIQQYHIANTLLVVQDSTLDSSTYSHHLVRVNTLRRHLAEEVLNQCLHSRDTT